MSVFNELLASRQLARHSGQALWAYALDDAGFLQLSQTLAGVSNSEELDPVDCALYYAEWWKRCYNGGIPSKREVLDSIDGLRVTDEERFFQLARKGGQLLGVRWIKNQNTLYFKTLLLQGGLPVRHMSAHSGNYKNFLLKIIELNPSTIDDFAFDNDLTALLPKTSRNPEIYECCLSIVKAIMDNDEAYLSILNENRELNEISSELRVKKLSLRAPVRRTRIKVAWMLDTHKKSIRLYLAFPEFTTEQFRNLFIRNSEEDQLDYVYKCYYNGVIVCKFIKKANGQYKTDWVNQHDLFWDGGDQLPDIYLTGIDGKRHICNDLVGYLPRLDQATLWTAYDDTQYTLEKGRHTTGDIGFVLSLAAQQVSGGEAIEELELYGGAFQLIRIRENITVHQDGEERCFKTSSKKIDWYILDQRPKWIKRANYPITAGKPHIIAEDENGPIKNVDLKWRQSLSMGWNNWSVPIPAGLTELKLQIGDIIEYDTCFMLGRLERHVRSENLHQAQIELVNNPFVFQINENPWVHIDKAGPHTITLNLTSTSHIPAAIHGSLRSANQARGLQFEMEPPFHGVAILDPGGEVLANNSSLTLNKLYGYRLMTNQDQLIVNMSNTSKKDIIIAETLERGLSSLMKLEDKIIQLYALSDIMDSTAEILLEIAEQKQFGQIKLAEYRIQRYEQRITWNLDDQQRLQLQTAPLQPELFAVPLDCALNELYLRDLVWQDGIYTFRNENSPEKYIAFCGKEVRIQPEFICSDPLHEQTSAEDRLERIAQLRDELLTAGPDEEIWQRLLAYFRICQQNALTYATFDILRATGFSSELAARAFVFLAYSDETETFISESCGLLERDIGFCFHWAAREHWLAATEWIGCQSDEEVAELIFGNIFQYFEEQQPAESFKETAGYIFRDTTPRLKQGFHLNTEISKMRSLLGSKVLAELPKKCPKVPEVFKSIIGVNADLANVKLLLKSPVTVALSIANVDHTLWKKENEDVRRHVRYSQLLNPAWYSEAINYCLTKNLIIYEL